MSGNAWKFSDQIDDEDLQMLNRDFISYYQGADYYGLGLKVFTRMAHEAGAIYKIGKRVLIRRDIFDEYLRKRQLEAEEKRKPKFDNKESKLKQGIIVPDPLTGRMDIRFGLDEYYGGLHCGTKLEVLINGEWNPTRIEMGNDWFLCGIQTDSIIGLTVRI